MAFRGIIRSVVPFSRYHHLFQNPHIGIGNFQGLALDHNDVYQHDSASDLKIRTTGSFDEAMNKTTARELYLYFPDMMNYEISTDPDVTRDDFYNWANNENLFSKHGLEIGARIEGNRVFHGMDPKIKLFAFKNFLTTFTLDSVIDKLHQSIDQNPIPETKRIMENVAIELAGQFVSKDGNIVTKPSVEIPLTVVKTLDQFLCSYNDLIYEGDQLLSPKYMAYLKKLWARFVQSAATEVYHKLDQQAKGLSIDPWFWGAIRPYSAGHILTGSVLFADEPEMPDLDDPLQHDIHLVDVYDNELLSFHKEQSQSHFNMINGLMSQGLSRELVFMTWTRRRNIHCRDIELLVQGNTGNMLDESYRRLFRYQLELFNYHIWTPHRCGWNRA